MGITRNRVKRLEITANTLFSNVYYLIKHQNRIKYDTEIVYLMGTKIFKVSILLKKKTQIYNLEFFAIIQRFSERKPKL